LTLADGTHADVAIARDLSGDLWSAGRRAGVT